MDKITYHREGDYLYPNLYAPEPESETPELGKYGSLRKKFLKENFPAYYAEAIHEGLLDELLQGIDETAEQRVKVIVKGLLKTHPAPDRNEDYLAYVGHINNLTAMAEESVFRELVYARPSQS